VKREENAKPRQYFTVYLETRGTGRNDRIRSRSVCLSLDVLRGATSSILSVNPRDVHGLLEDAI
jgi:hypothetical protein